MLIENAAVFFSLYFSSVLVTSLYYRKNHGLRLFFKFYNIEKFKEKLLILISFFISFETIRAREHMQFEYTFHSKFRLLNFWLQLKYNWKSGNTILPSDAISFCLKKSDSNYHSVLW